MEESKFRTFRTRLDEDLKDPEFKAHYHKERQALKLALKIAKLRRSDRNTGQDRVCCGVICLLAMR